MNTGLVERPPAKTQEPAQEPTATGIIGAIVSKDVTAFRRDRFLVLITLLVLICWGVIFHLLPTTDETVTVGVTAPQLTASQAFPTPAGLGESGVEVRVFDDEAALRAALDSDEGIAAGLVFPPDLVSGVARGERPQVQVLVPVGTPPQIQELLATSVTEIGYQLAGTGSPVDMAATTVIVGTDRLGDPVSMAEQMRPLLLLSVLVLEIFALATLVAGELQTRTAAAVMTTPAKPWHFLTAKALFGTSLAFIEVVILGLLIGAFASNAPAVLGVLLLGALLATGFGLFMGALGRDFIETLVFTMLLIVPLMVPAFAALFPGASPAWVQLLPTYGLTELLVQTSAGFVELGDLVLPVLSLLLWSFAAFALGLVFLRRQVVNV